MQTNLIQIETEFNNIINNKLKKTKDQISLIQLQKQIKKLLEIRNALIKKFLIDIKYLTSNQINFSLDKYHLLKENCFDLIIKDYNQQIECLLKPNDIYQIRDFKTEQPINLTPELATLILKIMPCINALFTIINNQETSNILANTFYQSSYVAINNSLEYLEVSGLGITLPYEKMFQLNLNTKERANLFQYYQENLTKILKKIYVLNNQELSNYQTNQTKGKVLKMYKGGFK